MVFIWKFNIILLYTGLIGYNVYYSTALCSGWNAWPSGGVDCPNSDTCAEYGKLTILSNTTIYITVKECTATYIQFNAVDDGLNECPANEGNYCYDYEECVGTVFSFNSGNVKAKNIAIKVYVISSGKSYSYVVC